MHDREYRLTHQAAATAAIRHERWSAGLSGNYVGAMRDRAGQGELRPGEGTDPQWLLDAVGSLPLYQDKFMLLARVGVQTSKTSDLFYGTGAGANLTNPSPSKNKVSYKYGAGAEYDFTQNIGARVEWERYQVSDGISGNVNVNFVSGSSRRITGPTRR